jgi:hypothetical protein
MLDSPKNIPLGAINGTYDLIKYKREIFRALLVAGIKLKF